MGHEVEEEAEEAVIDVSEVVRFDQIPHTTPWGPWPAGPWSEEPDDVDGVDPATGYVYALRRNDFGFWCGYVCLPRRHPWHGRHYEDPKLPEFPVHGGLTFSDSWIARSGPRADTEGAWWLGFDCGHGFDVVPAFVRFPAYSPAAAYRDLAYARKETLTLAAFCRKAESLGKRHG